MTDLSKIGKREELKPRPGDEPHWQRLRSGCFVGYRPSARGGPGDRVEELPDLELDDVRACIGYARRGVDHPVLSGV